MTSSTYSRTLFLLALAACSAKKPPPPPRLVVLVVIDQLSSWSFARREPLVTSGLRRLLDEGVVFTNARYPYAATYTAPGHAALVTGAPPRVTGILANEWWDRDAGGMVDAVDDEAAPLIALSGLLHGETGASPKRLLAPTVGDLVTAAGGKVVTVGLKPRGTIMLGGQHPTAAVFFDPAQRAMTTSRFYTASAPAWLSHLAEEQALARRIPAYVWTPLDAALLGREAGRDDAPGEVAFIPGADVSFPHELSAAVEPASAVHATALGDEIVLEAALAALDGEGLGSDDKPDLLLVSFSVHDYVGHSYGAESWESLDVFLRLDRHLGALMQRLDERVGPGRYALVLTSDHGVTRRAEDSQGGGRLDIGDVRSAAGEAARAAAGDGEWLEPTRGQFLYLSAAGRALPAARRDELLDGVVRAVRAVDGVGYAARTSGFAQTCDGVATGEQPLCLATHPARAGEIIWGTRPGWAIMRKPFIAAAHGSSNPEDTDVPLVIRAPGLAGRRSAENVSMLRVAPTLAGLLGVPAPAAATEKPLLP
jgi:predicted AlkP superfamily pyrophosphatase or phosphodiesterase